MKLVQLKDGDYLNIENVDIIRIVERRQEYKYQNPVVVITKYSILFLREELATEGRIDFGNGSMHVTQGTVKIAEIEGFETAQAAEEYLKKILQ